jgi:hypothetical protein
MIFNHDEKPYIQRKSLVKHDNVAKSSSKLLFSTHYHSFSLNTTAQREYIDKNIEKMKFYGRRTNKKTSI